MCYSSNNYSETLDDSFDLHSRRQRTRAERDAAHRRATRHGEHQSALYSGSEQALDVRVLELSVTDVHEHESPFLQ